MYGSQAIDRPSSATHAREQRTLTAGAITPAQLTLTVRCSRLMNKVAKTHGTSSLGSQVHPNG